MGSLPDVLRALLESRGVRFVMGTEISSLRRQQGTPTTWAVESATTTTSADAVILATPSATTASILRPLDPEVAALLDQIEYSSVGVITFEFSEGTVTLPEHGTGVLVPPGTPIPSGPRAGERFFTTALTFLDRKWPHQKQPGRILLRTSVGRIDDTRMASMSDEALTAAALDEMAVLFGGVGVPLASGVSRWNESLPQYRVNHLMRVAGIEAGVARLPGLAVCGAAYRGVGVPACIASGRAAGRSISSTLNRDR
jgi:oxygen-dependent protoporphyrinogen oxidase